MVSFFWFRATLTMPVNAVGFDAVGAVAVDVEGRPAPFANPTGYERASVSGPFGNGIGPSTACAGGGACPDRSSHR